MASSGKWDNEASRVSLEDFRQYHETDKQWAGRKQFVARHLHLYPGPKTDQLIALSVVWSNIVFIGNRYGEKLTEKVHKMAEGIDIGEMPSFELVPGAKKTSGGADNGEQPPKKFASRFGPRPRFEPVRFVVSSTQEDSFQESINGSDSQKQDQQGDSLPPDVCTTTSDTSDQEYCSEMDSFHSDAMEDEGRHDSGNFMSKIEQNYSAKFNSHYSTMSKEFCSNVLDMWKGVNRQGRKGIGFVKPPKMSDKLGKEFGRSTLSGRTLHSLDKAAFIKQLSATILQKMSSPKQVDPERMNYTFMLSCCTQPFKTNPEYIYVPLKEISPLELPKYTQLPVDGFACEVRCQDIYLATGYSGSKNGARERAAEQAVQLLQRSIEVRKMNRRFGQTFREEWVACPIDMPEKGLPPALKQEDSSNCEMSPCGQQSADPAKVSLPAKQWTDFILTENACDAIGILNNSADVNKMTVEYKYTMMSNTMWKCSIFVQDHCLAEAYGNKKSSKHEAAKEAVRILKTFQPKLQKTCEIKDYVQATNNGPIKELKDIVVYAKSTNPVCTLNDTAQFNNVTVDYVFERLTGDKWKCKVLMDSQFLAEAVGIKKSLKHDVAEAAVRVLKQTQPVVVNNLNKGTAEDAISRNQISGWSKEESFKQKIKEDNIGNQLLRKMGWKGGGLGKEGGGISEPISVKEQFSREGLGLTSNKINKRDIEKIIRNYANSYNQDDLTFAKELSNEERKNIHQISQKYGLRSKSHGQGTERFLVVSRKRSKQDLIHQLRQEGQVGSYALLMPQQ
uniref:LOC100158424 protein n=1 Tax=Xenopus laevis TaxID=8355 RepID=B1WBC2_XENLA|nr:LOC100158424 protein [Xenopus laevis]